MRRMNFAGGEQVEDMLAKIIEKAQAVGTLKVGFLEGSTYPDGQGVAEVAAYNEFGTQNMPARPFFRSMIAEKSGNWGKSLGNIAKATNYDVARTLALMGEGIGSQLQQSIVKYNAVPLADSTVARKGFAKQLIDTATMVNSVGYEVNDGEKHILPPAAQGGGK
ncbi:hypothetical protein [Herbaspirillum huttiense]|uniref:Uncharacterized protein n=2 Tax=Herbaspirillum huttiense TaxID=863372 RepID=A0AAJ2H9U3_9BURK|nr:hypothetical protein [Herbaspirillum huttiense]MDR9839454.1 hypothetical protein [Herbaspirillum huttiense]